LICVDQGAKTAEFLPAVNACTLFPGGVTGKGGRLIRVGTSGLAVKRHEGIEIISGVFVTD
jgi:hypothetical protein